MTAYTVEKLTIVGVFVIKCQFFPHFRFAFGTAGCPQQVGLWGIFSDTGRC